MCWLDYFSDEARTGSPAQKDRPEGFAVHPRPRATDRLRVALGGTAACALVALAATVLQGQDIRQQLPSLAIESLGPTESFNFYCATCHGQSGTGDGVIARELRTLPADLTTLAERNGGAFPRDRVRAYVAGTGRQIAAHGDSEMPVWGPAFRALDASDTRAQVRIEGLVSHIESLQRDENGAELFRANCAACHGAMGQGNGPLAAQLRTPPPDLTQFTVRNGGVFPGEVVRRIIDGRDVASHGDPAMPVWGDTFRRATRDASDEAADARIAALVRYLRSIQERPAE
jgi:cytochrome c553